MRTHLDAAYDNESRLARRVWLTQPMGAGVVRDMTWIDAMNEVRRVTAYLRSTGLPPGSRIALFSKNCAWWFLADLAIASAGHVSVPIYPNLAATTIRGILEHSDCRVVFVGKLDDYGSLRPGLPASMTKICLPLSPESSGTRWDDIVKAIAPIQGRISRNGDDLATIVYTSGSTGTPKGAAHSFRTMSAAREYIPALGYRLDDRVLSYLPLAHVGERGALEVPNLFVGFRVFFAESLDTFITDLRRARPTMFGSVPRLWLRLRHAVHERISERWLWCLMAVPAVRTLIGRRILGELGLDQVRTAISGSAPTPPELIAWYGKLGLSIRELYAMTENFSVSHLGRPNGGRAGWIGPPLRGVDHRLGPDNEVLVRSPGCMLGYHLAPELTNEVLDSAGWLRTGDLGEIDDSGNLRVTGRTKDLFKTSKGKYVAPVAIENALLASSLVEQAIVTGVGAPQPIALVVLARSARPRGREPLTRDLEALRVSVNGRLDRHERLDRLVVVNDEWTPERGLLTPTLKIRRNVIEQYYIDCMDTWLKAGETIVWQSRAPLDGD